MEAPVRLCGKGAVWENDAGQGGARVSRCPLRGWAVTGADTPRSPGRERPGCGSHRGRRERAEHTARPTAHPGPSRAGKNNAGSAEPGDAAAGGIRPGGPSGPHPRSPGSGSVLALTAAGARRASPGRGEVRAGRQRQGLRRSENRSRPREVSDAAAEQGIRTGKRRAGARASWSSVPPRPSALRTERAGCRRQGVRGDPGHVVRGRGVPSSAPMLRPFLPAPSAPSRAGPAPSAPSRLRLLPAAASRSQPGPECFPAAQGGERRPPGHAALGSAWGVEPPRGPAASPGLRSYPPWVGRDLDREQQALRRCFSLSSMDLRVSRMIFLHSNWELLRDEALPELSLSSKGTARV
ncbi:PREDICTED: translation initiation factor IF-2-like isoform X3 [Chinchilla lanigera]|uniref:translation initiation factor IF-2-like isoform X3 n=1 Tax=Chinchilla lanigera TaxID=34839 RepID=UPI000697D31B|nr:PREDICTED: translation initiation factor IF-2-like isoform X3 [Chinchilla lanigera]